MSLEHGTALKYGYKPDATLRLKKRNWFDVPRETRALWMAGEQISNLSAQIEAWDDRQKAAFSRGKS